MAKKVAANALWTLLKWEGGVTNLRVRELFGVERNQAARMLKSLGDETGLVTFDPSSRDWVTPQLGGNPKLDELGGDLDEYTTVLSRSGDAGTWFVDARPHFLDPVAVTLRLASAAARNGRGLLVTYHSMTDPKGRQRVIFPHAVVRLSQRWHLRAWCADRRDYRDFNVGRLTAEKLLAEKLPPEAGPDVGWNTIVPLRILPHRDLSIDHWELVRKEYFPRASARRLAVRGPLVHYTLQAIQVAIDPVRDRPPQFLLEVANPEKLEPWLFPQP